MIRRPPYPPKVLLALFDAWGARLRSPRVTPLVLDIRVVKKGKVEDATFTFPFCNN